MNVHNQQKNWIIDIFLLVGFLISFYLELTGVILHQWIGVALMVLGFVHLLVHWDWVKAVTIRFFNGKNPRNRWYYLIDLLIMLGFVVIVETGLVISTWFNLALNNYVAWLDIHIYASITTLALTVLKVGLHWRWVVTTTKKMFSFSKQPLIRPVLTPALVPVRVNAKNMERREFLSVMGVVGLGSLLAVSNVLSKGSVENVAAFSDPDLNLEDSEILQTGETIQPEPTDALFESTPTKTITTEDGPVITATATPEATIQTSTIAACTVGCNRRCSYPGHCRRYIDQNNNRKCDLGECV